MPTVYLKKDSGGKVLLVGGKVAIGAGCCCGCCPFTTVTVSMDVVIEDPCGASLSVTLPAITYTAGIDFTDPNLFEAAAQTVNMDGFCPVIPECCTEEDPPPDCVPDPECENYAPNTDVAGVVILTCYPGAIGIGPGVSARFFCSSTCFVNVNEGPAETIVNCEDLIGTHVLSDSFGIVTLTTTVTFA